MKYSNLYSVQKSFIETDFQDFPPGGVKFVPPPENLINDRVYYYTFFKEDGTLVNINEGEEEESLILSLFYVLVNPSGLKIRGIYFLAAGVIPVHRERQYLQETPSNLYSPNILLPLGSHFDGVNPNPDPFFERIYNQGLIKLGFGNGFVKAYFTENEDCDRWVYNGSCFFGLNESKKQIESIIITGLTNEQVYTICYKSRPNEWKERFPQIYNHPKPHEYIQHGNIEPLH